jgi:hypothetical protein
VLLNRSQYLPIGHEDGHDTPHPGRHFSLDGHQEKIAAVDAVVVAIQVHVLMYQFTTMSAGAFHGLNLDPG